MASKYCVPDSNIILTNAKYVINDLAGEGDFLVIPAFLYEEIDNLKGRCGQMENFNISEFFRNIKKLSHDGDLAKGVKNSKGATVIIMPSDKLHARSAFYNDWDPEKKVDNKILVFAEHLGDKHGRDNVLHVTFDNGVIGKTNCLGIKTLEINDIRESAKKDFISGIYKGYRHLNVCSNLMEIVKSKSFLLGSMLPDEIKSLDLCNNEYLILNNNYDLLCRYFKGNIVVRHYPNKVFGIGPIERNIEQKFAWDLLFDKDIRIVTLVGGYGTGKTFLALLAGMAQTKGFPKNHYEQLYNGIMVVVPTRCGKHTLGYSKGNKRDKMKEWLGCIFDNFGAIKINGASIPEGVFDELITFENLENIGGRSLHYKYLLVEEAHDFNKHEMEKVLSRGAKGTKIVVGGDPFQSRFSDQGNGLLYTQNVLKGYPETGSIFLEKVVRDRIAEIIAEAF